MLNAYGPGVVYPYWVEPQLDVKFENSLANCGVKSKGELSRVCWVPRMQSWHSISLVQLVLLNHWVIKESQNCLVDLDHISTLSKKSDIVMTNGSFLHAMSNVCR